jgi:hypothetical protein
VPSNITTFREAAVVVDTLGPQCPAPWRGTGVTQEGSGGILRYHHAAEADDRHRVDAQLITQLEEAGILNMYPRIFG